MNSTQTHQGLALDTFCGTALAVSMNIGSNDLIKTVVLAALGALVSFSVSCLLKWLIKKWKRP